VGIDGEVVETKRGKRKDGEMEKESGGRMWMTKRSGGAMNGE